MAHRVKINKDLSVKCVKSKILVSVNDCALCEFRENIGFSEGVVFCNFKKVKGGSRRAKGPEQLRIF